MDIRYLFQSFWRVIELSNNSNKANDSGSARDAIVIEEEQFEPVEEHDYRFKIAICATVGYIGMLTLAISVDALQGKGLFERVAAAVSGPMGAIWGYYFGSKRTQ